jgi:hypothetical protein
MKTTYLCFIAAIVTLLLMNCLQPTASAPTGAFEYTSYDSSGTALVTGWYTMNFTDSATISGKWHFRPIGSPTNIGPQTGDGNLVGGVENGRVWIELNPQFIDNNLHLSGTLQGDRYYGQWMWLSYSGISNAGKFEAVRK